MVDAHKNFAYSLVATAPSPADSGTTLIVTFGTATRFPAVPFNAVIWPEGNFPLSANAEIVRVTDISDDTLTITRAQESSSARNVVVGDQISAAITAKAFTDIETEYAKLGGVAGGQSLIGSPLAGEHLVLRSSSHPTTWGKVFFGHLFTTLYDEVGDLFGIGTATPSAKLHITNTTTNQRHLRIDGAVTSDRAAILIDPTITQTAASIAGVAISPTFVGAVSGAVGLNVTAIHVPSVSVSSLIGIHAIAYGAPGAGVIITTLTGLNARADTGSGAGSITSVQGIQVGPNYGSQKPTNATGINILDMGSAGVTTAVGLNITKPTAATANYYMKFDVADATVAGAYFGRLPILYNGLLKYIHVFSA